MDVQLKASSRVAVIDTTGSSTYGTSLSALLTGEGYQVELVSRAGLTEFAGRVSDYDLVVFNATLLSSQQQPFLDALDAARAAGVSTILPSQYGGSHAIPLLSSLRGDPASADWDFVSVGVDYVPTSQHPIFAGYPVGTPIELLTSTLSNLNQQYGAFSGWSGVTVGRLQSRVDGSSLGDAVGYQFSSPSSVDVLLSSLAASTYGWPDERWTDHARRIYLNAVAWAIDARQAELTGVVTGEGSPVAGATVSAVEAGVVAITAADGTYYLGLPGGKLTITVEAHGFATHTEVVELPQEGLLRLDVDLVPPPRGSVAGSVTSVDGAPVAGAELEASAPTPWTATTGEAGEFTVGELLEGSYDVSVTADGYLPAHASVTVVADTTAQLDITLRPLDVGVLGDVDMTVTHYLRDAGVAAASLEWGDDVSTYRAIVVNGGSPDEGTFEAFLDAADAAEVSLIFTGTWGVDRGGVRLLERYTDRVSVGDQGSGDGAVVLPDFDAAHALFAGLPDPAELVVAGGSHSVLESYPGEPLASLSVARDDGSVLTGLSAGWDRRTSSSVEIVLSTSAVTEVQGPGRGWTTEAGRLLVNAVEWAEFVSGASWDTAGQGNSTTVMLRLAGSEPWPPPADSATLVIVDAQTGAEVVRQQMSWAGLFYLATAPRVGARPYLVGAEVVIDGIRFDLPGPRLSP